MLAAVLCATALAGCQNQAANAVNGKSMIEDFAHGAFPGYEVVYASCATMDTNDDGYLRGTLVIRKGDTMRVWAVLVPETGDPLQLQKAHAIILAEQQPFDNRL